MKNMGYSTIQSQLRTVPPYVSIHYTILRNTKD
jgi:hypothetical protein